MEAQPLEEGRVKNANIQPLSTRREKKGAAGEKQGAVNKKDYLYHSAGIEKKPKTYPEGRNCFFASSRGKERRKPFPEVHITSSERGKQRGEVVPKKKMVLLWKRKDKPDSSVIH